MCGLVLSWAIWMREPPLVLYTSPPMVLDEKTFRLQALVPANWHAEGGVGGGVLSYSRDQGNAIVTACFAEVSPPERPCRWMPEWLRMRLFGTTEQGGVRLSAVAEAIPARTSEEIYRMVLEDELVASRWLTIRGSVALAIDYHRQNRAAFESTYRRVCGSFRVIPVDRP